KSAQRYRSVAAQQVAGLIDFASNDYLGLATDPQVVQALRHATRAGSGGSRLLSGRHREHSLLEEELAAFLGRERALLFSSGYHAALGAVVVLAGIAGSVLSDERNHACLIDGIALAKVPRAIYPHVRPAAALRKPGDTLLVTESIFSMDGDRIAMDDVLTALRAGDVALIDEAHAIGVAGPGGAGVARGFADPRIVVMGTLSKALGVHGGFVAGPAAVIELMVNRARTFIFDTALPPALALAARVALHVARLADDRRSRLQANVERLLQGLAALDVEQPVARCQGPIVALVLGSEERAMQFSHHLLVRKIFAPAIRPPTVAPGSSRLRFSIRADHTPEHVDLLVKALRECTGTS
ncbi:MAG TPA: aminotransferase class I/II-fold pyridoxal phosphate-dependent enzyme, partial [Candidatus Baltobacteraceae bacterium]|nr:aminotransferase class I/II-fold pyridoxal phosphate-dependent enzyme [Candidatus Baltobacteraceae bacterium]